MTDAAQKKIDDGKRLDQWMGEMYRADILGRGNVEDVWRRAQSTVAADPALLALAKERIPELAKTVRVRPNEYAEKKKLEYLEHLIKEPA